MRKERQYICETVEKVLRKMLGDRSVTAVDVFKVELYLCSSRHFLASAIMYRHETVKFEKGETLQM